MQLQSIAPERHVTRVYRRKRISQAASVSDDVKTPELVRLPISPCSSATQGQDEPFPRSPSNESSRRCTTPPSTPRRKRATSSQLSSPNRSPSKIKLDKDLGILFSPNGKLPKAPSSNDIANCEEQETFIANQSFSPYEVHNRMRSRPPRKLSRWQSSEQITLATAPVVEDATSQQGDAAIKAEETTFEQLEQPASRAMDLSIKQRKTYGKTIPSVRPQQEAPSHVAANVSFLPARPSWNDFSQRWAEMDDLDSVEPAAVEGVLIKSITGLRDRGQDRRSREDFEYLVMDLKADQLLRIRRSTCVELCRKILETDEDDEAKLKRARSISIYSTSYKSPVDLDCNTSKATESGSIGVFLRYIMSNGLIGTLWRQMRSAGAGKGNDEALDLALALVCAKISTCDPSSLQILALQDDFYAFVVDCLQVRRYVGKTTAREKKVKPLLDLAGNGHGHNDDEDHWINQIALEILAAAIDLPNYFKSQVPLDIRTKSGDINAAKLLWIHIASERQKVKFFGGSTSSSNYQGPDQRNLYLLGQIISDCVEQVDKDDLLAGSIEDVTVLLRFLSSRFFEGNTSMVSLQALCALLSMSVGMISLTTHDWRAAFLRVNSFLHFVVESVLSSALNLLSESGDLQRGSTEIFTLFLALLTDVVNVEISEIRSMMLVKSDITSHKVDTSVKTEFSDKEKDGVYILAQLLLQEKKKSDADANAGYVAGSVAVLLALLIVGNPVNVKEACDTSQQETNQIDGIISSLSRGLESDEEDISKSIQMLISIIEDFSSTVQAATKTLRAMIGKLKTQEEIQEDQHFFRYLISSLKAVAASQSSGQMNHT